MSWEKVKLGIFLKARENRFKPDDKSIRNLKRVDKIDFSGTLHLSNSPSKTDMILVKKGDLLISGINVAKGAVVVYEGEEDIVATIHYSSYEFDKNKIDIEFLKLFLKSPEFLDAIKEQVPGGIKTEIKPKHFLPLEVLMPTLLSEQREVVSYFSSIEIKNDNLSAELTHQLDLVKQLRQALLREAMQGNLVPQDKNDEPASELLKKIKAEKEQLIKEKKIKKEKELPPIKLEEIPFEIPGNWVWCRLGELIELYSGQDLEPNFYSDSDRRGIPYITGASNLLNGTVIENRWTRTPKSIAKKGDLLLTCKGSGVGKMAFLSIQEAHIARQIMALRTSLVPLIYLKIIIDLETPNFKLKAKSLIPGIDRDLVLNIPCPLPPLSEQHRIIAKLEQLMRYCDELEQSIKQNQTQNEQLLQQVLREALRPEKEYKIKDEMSLAAEP